MENLKVKNKLKKILKIKEEVKAFYAIFKNINLISEEERPIFNDFKMNDKIIKEAIRVKKKDRQTDRPYTSLFLSNKTNIQTRSNSFDH